MSAHLRLVKPSSPPLEKRITTGILREFGAAFVKKQSYDWLYQALLNRLAHH